MKNILERVSGPLYTAFTGGPSNTPKKVEEDRMFLRLDKNRLADGNTLIFFFKLFMSLLTKIQPGNIRSGTMSFKMFNFIHLSRWQGILNMMWISLQFQYFLSSNSNTPVFSVNVSLTSSTVEPICLCDISSGIFLWSIFSQGFFFFAHFSFDQKLLTQCVSDSHLAACAVVLVQFFSSISREDAVVYFLSSLKEMLMLWSHHGKAMTRRKMATRGHSSSHLHLCGPPAWLALFYQVHLIFQS